MKDSYCTWLCRVFSRTFQRKWNLINVFRYYIEVQGVFVFVFVCVCA